MRTSLALLACVSLIFAAACGDDGDESGSSTPTNTSNNGTNTGAPAGPDIANGAVVFMSNGCTGCHGEDPTQVGNFVGVKRSLTERADEKEYFTMVMRNGIPGSAMNAYTSISDEDLEDMRAYFVSLK